VSAHTSNITAGAARAWLHRLSCNVQKDVIFVNSRFYNLGQLGRARALKEWPWPRPSYQRSSVVARPPVSLSIICAICSHDAMHTCSSGAASF
jgi:hypothetical protein